MSHNISYVVIHSVHSLLSFEEGVAGARPRRVHLLFPCHGLYALYAVDQSAALGWSGPQVRMPATGGLPVWWVLEALVQMQWDEAALGYLES